MTRTEQWWAELRSVNKSLLPWAKLAPKTRAELEAHVLGGCGCSCCEQEKDDAAIKVGRQSDGNGADSGGK